MHITIKKDVLLKTLQKIQGIHESKSTLPILSHFLITAESEHSLITATNLEVSFRCLVTLAVTEGGQVCIPIKKFTEIVKELEGDVTLKSEDKNWLRVKNGKSSFKVACLPAGDFPVWPAVETRAEFKLQASILLDLIDKTIYAAGENDTRYVLNGILFDISAQGVLKAVATDGHRLAAYGHKLDTTFKENLKAVIPKKAFVEIKKILGDVEDSTEVSFTLGRNHAQMLVGDQTLLIRLIEGNFPAYEQIIPKTTANKITAPREALIKALKRVHLIGKGCGNKLRFDASLKNIVVSSTDNEIGDAKDEIDISMAGEQLATAFNSMYLLNALAVIGSDTVLIGIDGPQSPAVIREAESEHYCCVVMPMK